MADIRQSWANRVSDRGMLYLFIIPTFALLLFIVVFPLIWSLCLSFCEYSANAAQPPQFVGIRNYSFMFQQKDIWERFAATGKFVAMAVACEFLLGFGIAMLLNRDFYGKSVLTTLFILPMMFSPAVIGKFFRFMFDTNWGIINYLLGHLFGISKIAWTTSYGYALYSLVITDIWIWTPFMVLLSLAGISSVPQYLYEAADVDRASGWFKFRYITLPFVAPILLLALLFRTMDAFRFFDLVYVLTEGGPGYSTQLIPYYIYKLAFSYWRTGDSCALAYILLIIIIALSNIYITYLNWVRRG
ncbi:MAG: sugar ABC transporter permease [Candidatus Atribacteria bacterium]|nr:sugar ABC transporter permease [Candidatus Atribacteria bacterium]MCD6350033.1 sugar ABC transporter permease [Candidatus Atribacteria bacterium]